ESAKGHRSQSDCAVELTNSSLSQFLKYVEDVCVAKKCDPFAALMSIAQDQQGSFTTKQAIEAVRQPGCALAAQGRLRDGVADQVGPDHTGP
ncbi:MAG: hypothetical protein ACYC23_19955, partial [Limisphaerales bacterium]